MTRTLAIVLVLCGVMATWRATAFLPALNDAQPLAATPPVVGPAGPRLSRRVVLVIVDGLRADTAKQMPALASLAKAGYDGVARAPFPTLSMPNYVTLTTGVAPRYSGYRTNDPHGSDAAVRIDSLFTRVRAAGMRVGYASAGTTAMTRLFPDLAKVEHADFTVVVIMDVDRAGHRHGGSSNGYLEAARTADDEIGRIYRTLDPALDTMIVTADHGHTDRGGHGGDSPTATHVPFVMVGAGVRDPSAIGDAGNGWMGSRDSGRTDSTRRADSRDGVARDATGSQGAGSGSPQADSKGSQARADSTGLQGSDRGSDSGDPQHGAARSDSVGSDSRSQIDARSDFAGSRVQPHQVRGVAEWNRTLELVDVAPTIAALLGVPAPGQGGGATVIDALAIEADRAAALVSADAARHVAIDRAEHDLDLAAETKHRGAMLVCLPVAVLAIAGIAAALLVARRRRRIHTDGLGLAIGAAFPIVYFASALLGERWLSEPGVPGERLSLWLEYARCGGMAAVAFATSFAMRRIRRVPREQADGLRTVAEGEAPGRAIVDDAAGHATHDDPRRGAGQHGANPTWRELEDRRAQIHGSIAVGLAIVVAIAIVVWAMIGGTLATLLPSPLLVVLTPVAYMAVAWYALAAIVVLGADAWRARRYAGVA